MAAIRRLLFSDDFDPSRDTAILNEILTEIYTNISGKQSKIPPKVKVYRSTDKTITTATETAVDFDTEVFDTHNMWVSSSATRITFRESGTYLVIGRIKWAGNATGIREVQLRVNGTDNIDHEFEAPGNTTVISQQCAVLYPFNVNDYIELVVRQASGGDLVLEADDTRHPRLEVIQLATNT